MGSVRNRSFRWDRLLSLGYAVVLLAGATAMSGRANKGTAVDPAVEYTTEIRPLLRQYCFACHCSNKKKGDLDLERFDALDRVREDLAPWQSVVEMLDNGAMPPRKSEQPSGDERRRLLAWARGLLTAEARARAGDPGRVVVRRLSNAEYNNTVRDLIGVDLQPARDFPVDGDRGAHRTSARRLSLLRRQNPARLDR
jgi:mono/diheme cytochrome c family protein